MTTTADGKEQGCICSSSSLEGVKKDFSSFPMLFLHLKRIVDDNLQYFQKYTSKSVYKRFYDAFERIRETLGPMEEMAVYISERVTIFDFSPEVKGNGYRSLLRLLEQCIRALTELTYYCQRHRDRFYFRSHHYCLELEAHTDVFLRTKELFKYALTCIDESVEGQLFPETIDSRVLIEAELIDRECFYGRALGFQYGTGLRQFLHMVCVAMASFAEGYHRHKASPIACLTTSVLNSGKYTVNPEMRAKMIVKLTHKTNMEFCKAFWSLTEGFGIQVSHQKRVIYKISKIAEVLFIKEWESIQVYPREGLLCRVMGMCIRNFENDPKKHLSVIMVGMETLDFYPCSFGSIKDTIFKHHLFEKFVVDVAVIHILGMICLKKPKRYLLSLW